MTHHLRLGVVPAYLILCLILGGASAAGFWANMALQLLAIPIILWALLVRRNTPMASPGRQLIVLLVLVLLLIGLQLVPLPPSIWSALPGRDIVAAGYRLLDQPLPWLPLSLAPLSTWASALWLLPAIAVLLGIVKLGGFKPVWIAWGVAIVTVIAVAIGALQVNGGDQSPWYFYRVSNFGFNTGFFANANHMATLMVCAIPFLAALYLGAGGRRRSAQKASGTFVILGGALAVLVVGLIINSSLAGLGLAVPVAAASLLMIGSRRRKLPSWTAAVVVLLTIGSIAAAFSAPFQNNLTTAEMQGSTESRYTTWRTSLDAAGDFLPLGSGIGTFQGIYPRYEDPAKTDRIYVNHVHGDYIELLLETGVAGILLVLLFLLWWLRRTVAIWRAPDPDYYARAATIASAAILAHSIVDYPLRTAAIAALFAACAGLMADPRPRTRQAAAEPSAPKARHLSAD